MKYNPNEIEARWQKYWSENQTFAAEYHSDKPKYYVLDMFPYPSGAGLHVGHPLGYIASDIFARYKRHRGFNVLHPQGYDSFGLPAEQYAIQTGQHPEKTTRENIARYRQQLDQIGFSFDWSREVRTSSPEYYRWTQWIFIQLFESWYNRLSDRAESIDVLIKLFEQKGNQGIQAVCDEDTPDFTAEQWNAYSEEEKAALLLKYRMTYLAETEVNWCPALGTVLANDEIVNGVSERGGHPVVRKKMTQWSMRIAAYAERLLTGLDTIDWSSSIKESQTNWIGKSVGASVVFKVENSEHTIEVFTTRPDTIFGVSFMTLAPEHELVREITTAEQQAEVGAYIQATSKRSERERMADVKTISGVFTGAYAEHPFTQQPVPIWIGDYVLAGYGTGAVMAVPAGDERDYAFANHFGIEIKNIFNQDISQEPFTGKDGFELENSEFLNGLDYKAATEKVIEELEKMEAGQAKVNYRLRDAVFSRQRYWGEPFPVYYRNGMPQMIDSAHLPIVLPEVEKYLPTEDGQPPLGNATVWAWDTVNNRVVENTLIDQQTIFPLELNTMPGWAGSSWYWLRYMDPHNENEFVSASAEQYWEGVDLYIGGSEHATGHLLYARFWNKFLKDKGYVSVEEPFKKLINQGMILGTSAFVYRIVNMNNFSDLEIANMDYDEESGVFKKKLHNIDNEKLNKFIADYNSNIYVSYNVVKQHPLSDQIVEPSKGNFSTHYGNIKEILKLKFPDLQNEIEYLEFDIVKNHVDVALVNASSEMDVEGFKAWRPDFANAEFILEDNGKYVVGHEVEKMSKSKFNVVNPDSICAEYGADTLRLYEMFLGPLEQAKPWNTAGITGVSGFLKKFWKLYFDDNGLAVTSEPASKEAMKVLHKTIKKVQEDIENFSFNTTVSQFMIAVNELTQLKCRERVVLEPLVVLLSPYAPHIAEEVWSHLGHQISISTAPFPEFNADYLVESSKSYPVSFNGKTKFMIDLSLDLSTADIEAIILADERTQAQLQGREPKKVIVVPGKIINIVG